MQWYIQRRVFLRIECAHLCWLRIYQRITAASLFNEVHMDNFKRCAVCWSMIWIRDFRRHKFTRVWGYTFVCTEHPNIYYISCVTLKYYKRVSRKSVLITSQSSYLNQNTRVNTVGNMPAHKHKCLLRTRVIQKYSLTLCLCRTLWWCIYNTNHGWTVVFARHILIVIPFCRVLCIWTSATIIQLGRTTSSSSSCWFCDAHREW